MTASQRVTITAEDNGYRQRRSVTEGRSFTLISVERTSTQRRQIESFIARRFAEAYGARIDNFLPVLVALVDGGAAGAAGSGPSPGSEGTPDRGRGGDVAHGSGSFSLQTSILAASAAGTNAYDTCTSRITDGGYNISSDASLNLSGTSHKNTDPKVASLASNGGATQTIALQTRSPAIDAAPAFLCPPTDQRGVPRPQGVASDIGAYELMTLPAIVAQPQSQTNANGTPVTFTVTALGDADLELTVHEVTADGWLRRATFNSRGRFARHDQELLPLEGGRLLAEPAFEVRCAVLDHKTPCLAFALQEAMHVNVWRNRLADLDVEPGPWLREAKRAILAGAPDDTIIAARKVGQEGDRSIQLGTLRTHALQVVPGQKLAYVTDAAHLAENARRIVALADKDDLLFIECAFRDADAADAARKHHLTARQAGAIAAAARVAVLVPFHFSPRYYADQLAGLRSFSCS